MAELTRSEFKVLEQRRSQEDAKRLFNALLADGVIVVFDDPVEEEAELGSEVGFETFEVPSVSEAPGAEVGAEDPSEIGSSDDV